MGLVCAGMPISTGQLSGSAGLSPGGAWFTTFTFSLDSAVENLPSAKSFDAAVPCPNCPKSTTTGPSAPGGPQWTWNMRMASGFTPSSRTST